RPGPCTPGTPPRLANAPPIARALPCSAGCFEMRQLYYSLGTSFTFRLAQTLGAVVAASRFSNSSFTLLKRSRGLNGFDKDTVTPAFANSTCSSANPCAVSSITGRLRFPSLLAVVRRHHVEPRVLQLQRHHVQNMGFVIDHQYRFTRHNKFLCRL